MVNSHIGQSQRKEPMARKTIFVSDLSGKEIANERESVKITVTFGDARKGMYVIDAHPDDPEVAERELRSVGGRTHAADDVAPSTATGRR